MNASTGKPRNQSPGKVGLGDGIPMPQTAPRNLKRSRERTREELQLAMLRVKNKGKKLSISAVASEAGITPGLIHNTYPDIAEAIRAQVGKGTRQQRDHKIAELSKARERLKELRGELDAALKDIQRLASMNETLRQELDKWCSAASGKVAILSKRAQGSI